MNIQEVKVTVVRETPVESNTFRAPADVKKFWDEVVTKTGWYDGEKEMVVSFFLNSKHRIKGFNLVSIGILDSSLIHPRELFRPAIVCASESIILSHNHPSKDTTPSSEDIRVTRQNVEAGKILGIELLDSLIIGGNDVYSLRESGLVAF